MYWNFEEVEETLSINRFYSFFERELPSSYYFVGESHDFWECVYVVEGETYASSDDRVYKLKEGELIIHPPLVFHRVFTNQNMSGRVLIFSFSLGGSSTEILQEKVISLNQDEKSIIKMILNFLPKKDSMNKSMFWQTLRSYTHLLLLNFSEDKTTVKPATDFDSVVYQKAVNYLSENLTQKTSVTQVAKHCNVGTTFLKRVFKKYSGLGLHGYFLKMQLRNALELLKSGKSVTEVAIFFGFCSQPYFSSAFKREFGVSPSHYKEIS